MDVLRSAAAGVAATANPPSPVAPAPARRPGCATRSRIPTRPCPAPGGRARRPAGRPVAHVDPQAASPSAASDTSTARARRVAGRVGQRLLHDAVRRQRRRPADRAARQLRRQVHVHGRRPAASSTSCASSARPGCGAVRAGVVGLAQHRQQAAHVVQRGPRRRGDRVELRAWPARSARRRGRGRSRPARRSSTCGARPRRASPGRSACVPRSTRAGPAPPRCARPARPGPAGCAAAAAPGRRPA